MSQHPDEGKIVLTVPIPASEARALRAAAYDSGMSRAAFVRKAIREALAQLKGRGVSA